jgi:hypothetical protein
MELIDFIFKQQLSIQISVAALLVALLSFVNSIKTSSSSTALSRATKKTDISLKLLEIHILYKQLIARLKEMNPPVDRCREKVNALIGDMKQSINLCGEQQELIKKLPFIVGPAKLEELSRDVQKLYMEAETLVPEVNRIVEECKTSCDTCRQHLDSFHNDENSERLSCCDDKTE